MTRSATQYYDQWMQKEHKDQIGGFYPIVSETGQQNHIGGADTGAIQCWVNDMPRELYPVMKWLASSMRSKPRWGPVSPRRAISFS